MSATKDLRAFEDGCLYLFTSLTAGSSHIITATSRLETILKANKIQFQAIDIATDEQARRLWQRRAQKKKLPGLIKDGYVIGDLEEIEEWNEFGELKENIGDVRPLPPAGGRPGVNIRPPGPLEPGSPPRQSDDRPGIPHPAASETASALVDESSRIALPGAAEIAARNKAKSQSPPLTATSPPAIESVAPSSKAEESADAVKEESADTTKEESADTTKEESAERTKEESPDAPKRESLDPAKEESSSAAKEESPDPTKEPSHDTAKEESHDTTEEQNQDAAKEVPQTSSPQASTKSLPSEEAATSPSPEDHSSEPSLSAKSTATVTTNDEPASENANVAGKDARVKPHRESDVKFADVEEAKISDGKNTLPEKSAEEPMVVDGEHAPPEKSTEEALEETTKGVESVTFDKEPDKAQD